MRLVHKFPHSMPVDWSANHPQLIYIIEDGNDETLYVDYADKHFERPMAPNSADQLRQRWPPGRAKSSRSVV